MGLTRHSRDKRAASGARRTSYKKKRNHELARAPTHTRLGPRKVTKVRTHGGNTKLRALSLDKGTFNWSSLGLSAQCNILSVEFAADTSLQRTNTLVKNAVIRVGAENMALALEALKRDNPAKYEQLKTQLVEGTLEGVESQLLEKTVLAVITTRPGQIGVINGRILEGAELAFYSKKIKVKGAGNRRVQKKEKVDAVE